MTLTQPHAYQALLVSKALEIYAQTGMKVNRDYTPKRMMQVASRLTGKTFRPRDYLGAAKALKELVK